MQRKGDDRDLPAAYLGREAAFIKHELLKAYLKRLFLIVGMAARKLDVTELCYVDCFAGPWGDESKDLGSTSIAISLRILDECRQELKRYGRSVSVRALYVEKDQKAAARLRKHIAEQTPAGIAAEAIEGDFVELRTDILNWCGQRSFVFFFVDPKSWTPAGVKVLAPLLARRRSEFLINFMYDFLNRAASMADFKQHMVDLLGELPEVTQLHGWEREQKILSTYRKNLKAKMPSTSKFPARSAYVRILDRTKQRTKYHLVYLTTHHRGITVFMDASEKLTSVQRLVRAQTKQRVRIEKTGQSELFRANEGTEPADDTVDISSVERDWLTRLSREPKRFGEAEFATLMEETDWLPSDLQRALGNLIKSGHVSNLDGDVERKSKFLQWEAAGERLQLQTGRS